MDLFKSMSVFVRVAESGSFTAAASICDLSPTMVANHVQALENHLESRLIHRTTRKQNLTSFGRIYYDRCINILDLVKDSEAIAREAHTVPRGKLRVTVPSVFGNELLIPSLPEYLRLFPEVELDIVVSDSISDLADDGFDAAVRIGFVQSPDIIARPLLSYRLILCAAPSYIEGRPLPRSPDDLMTNHRYVTFNYGPKSQLPATDQLWHLVGPDGETQLPVKSWLKLDSIEGIYRAAIKGLGIAMISELTIAEDIASGNLVRLLPGFTSPERPLNLIYLRDTRMSPKLRSFLNFITEKFSKA